MALALLVPFQGNADQGTTPPRAREPIALRPSPANQEAPNLAPEPSNGPSRALLMLMATDRSLLDAGQMVANGPYSGVEGNLFTLRLSTSLFAPLLANGLSAAMAASTVPGGDPGVGGERDDPKRGYLRWRLGKDNDPAHLEVGMLSNTLGHGSTVRQYQNMPEGAPLAMGLVAQGELNGGGAMVMLGDFFHPTRFLAGRFRLKPLNIILSPDSALEPDGIDIDPRGAILGLLVVGAHAATDLEAPYNAEAVDANGQQLAGVSARPTSTFGLDLELAPFDIWLFHINPYVDGNMLVGRGDGPGFGLHPGVSVGTSAIGFFWLASFQYYVGSRGYKPWYFDTRYVFERTATVADGAPKAALASRTFASHGYVGGLSAQLAEMVTLWAEIGDQMPMKAVDGNSYGRLRLGATAGPTMANLTASFQREGWRKFDRIASDDGLTSFVAQGRVSLFIIALIARYSYGVEHNIDTGANATHQDFSVGTELAFSL